MTKILIEKEIVELTLEALEQTVYAFMDTEGSHGQIEVDAIDASHKAITAIKAVLSAHKALNTSLAQPERKPLTDEQAETIQKDSNVRTALLNYNIARNDRAAIALVKAIAAHGITYKG